ncbi:mitochondrial ribosome-associated GTPase 2 [Culicoides brevitarsis]|uniref:mitochondrial ribosome-associated GTPase 2 n=1 Tax=Culicoides brevitarsis TaxID=469753 RepID=UPI00307C05CE
MFSLRLISRNFMRKSLVTPKSLEIRQFCDETPRALRSTKAKSKRQTSQYFVDQKRVRCIAGKGGDGCISFLSVYRKEFAGPDGADGGNGGHVIFEATTDIRDLHHIPPVLQAADGEKGMNKNCSGKNAQHLNVKVPLGTVIRNDLGKVVGDLDEDGSMFIAARGGAGGKGNTYFASATTQAPQIAEHGAQGEDITYKLEIKTMAEIGLIGFPNAGKSTLLNAITRAKPKVASYPFTTLKPHVGMVQYDDYEQIAIADLPGLIPGSAENKGLGIQFLKHVERCAALLFIVDASIEEPWKCYETLLEELKKFSPELLTRSRLIVANKIDLPEAKDNIEALKSHVDAPVICISAKQGINVTELLAEIRRLYDNDRELQASDSNSS